jgi:molybdenum cofactor guanylyltransferase
MTVRPSACHGLLLNGGKSSRLGVDKGSQVVAGMSIAERAATALSTVADPVFIVGHDSGLGLPMVPDEGQGPLAAFVAGAGELRSRGLTGSILLVACDFPFITPALLNVVKEWLGTSQAALPVQHGFDQPLAACYSQEAVRAAGELLVKGRRSLQALIEAILVVRIPPEVWMRVAPAEALFDVDTPEQLEAARRMAHGIAAGTLEDGGRLPRLPRIR